MVRVRCGEGEGEGEDESQSESEVRVVHAAAQHSGTHADSDVQRDADTGRQRYSGELLARAKAVQDAAQGGMVLCSESCFSQVLNGGHWRLIQHA